MIPFYIFIKNGTIIWSQIVEYFYFSQNLLKVPAGFFNVSWSLCVEEWFYLLFPIPIFLFRKLGFKNLNAFCSTILIFYICCFLIRNHLLDDGIDNIRKIALARLDAITSGVLVAVIKINSKNRNTKVFSSAFLLLLISSAYLMFASNTSYTDNSLILFLVPLCFSFMLPLIELIKFPQVKFKLVNEFITNLSLWSYSIYLSHIPILFTLYYLTDDIATGFIMKLLVKITGLVLTIYVSKLLFKYFEIPITKKRPKEFLA